MITRIDNFKPYELATTRARVRHVLALPAQRVLGPLMATALGVAIWLGSFWVLLAVLFGICLQYIVEYCTHRFLYHMDAPDQVDGLFKWLYSSHWGHHDFPNNPNLWGGTSPWFVPVVASVFLMLEWVVLALFGVPNAFAYAFVCVFLGSVPTYTTYEWAHVTAHAAGKKNWLERYITREHAQHHFQDYSSNYHVNAGGIVVDRAFGTAFDRETYQRPEHIRTMGLAPDDPRLIELREIFADDYNITDTDRQKALI